MQDSRVSHLTHLSGMITGYFYLNWNWFQRKLKTLFKPKSPKVFAINEKKQSKVDNRLIQRRGDEILDKLSKDGWDNLSDAEQKILYRASEEFSRRDQPN